MFRCSLLMFLLLCVLPPQRAAAADAVGENYVTGQRHYTGDGVPQSYEKAAVYFRLAAEAGHPYAQYSLGLMYESGYGLPRDPSLAAQWYQKAAANGHQGAEFRLSLVREALDQSPRGGIRTIAESEGLPPMPAEIRILGAPEPKPAPVPVLPPRIVAAPAKPKPKLPEPRPIVAIVKPAAALAAPRPLPLPPPAQKPAPAPAPVAEIVVPPAAEPLAATVAALPPVKPAPAPRPAEARRAPAPAKPAPPVSAGLPGTAIVNPKAALEPETARALREYQVAMQAKDYPNALHALQNARYAGEIPALGLDEMRSAEALARLAILARDDNLALVYLRQASALGSIEAQTLLDQLTSGVDLRAMLEGSPAGAASPEARVR